MTMSTQSHYVYAHIVKFTEHLITSVKPPPQPARNIPQKLLRIILTDEDATDSSSDEERDQPTPTTNRTRRINTVRRVKRHVKEIHFKPLCPSPSTSELLVKQKPSTRKERTSPLSDVTRRKNFRGVRQRPWGRWAAETRDPSQRKQVWLGNFDTPEEAATVYDKAAFLLKGPSSVTNFTVPDLAEKDVAVDQSKGEGFDSSSPCSSLSSTMSVLFYEELRPFEGLEYVDLDAFGFHIDVPSFSTYISSPENLFAEDREFSTLTVTIS